MGQNMGKTGVISGKQRQTWANQMQSRGKIWAKQGQNIDNRVKTCAKQGLNIGKTGAKDRPNMCITEAKQGQKLGKIGAK